MKKYDIIVIGSGAAEAVTAEAASHGLKVASNMIKDRVLGIFE